MIAKILLGVWGVVEKRPKSMLLIGLILLVALGLGAGNVGVSNNYGDYLPHGSQAYKDIYKLDENFSNDQLIMLIEAKSGNTQAGMEEILSDQNMTAMRYFDEQFYDAEGNPEEMVQFVITPAFTVDLLRANAIDEGGAGNASHLLDEEGNLTRQGKGVFFNKGAARIALGLIGGLTNDEKAEFIEKSEDVLEVAGFDNNVTTTVTGSPFVLYYEETEVPKEISKIMIIAVICMLVVSALLFRVRGMFFWRWISLGLVLVGVLYTMGIMGWLDWDITVVSMAVFPILLGLGVDYSVQFHNRYDEEHRKGISASQAVRNTLERIGPPLVIAMIVACAGFAAVFFAETPMVQGFGKMLILGVGVCLFVSTMLLLPVLYLKDRRNDAVNTAETKTDSRIDGAATWLAHVSVKFTVPILIIAIAVAVFGWTQEDGLEGDVGYESYISADTQPIKDLNRLTALAGGVSPIDMVLTADNVLDPEILQWISERSKILMDETSAAKYPGEHFTGAYSNIAGFFEGAFGLLPSSVEQAETLLSLMPERFWLNYVSPDRTQAHLNFASVSPEADDKEVFTQDIATYFLDEANPPPSDVTDIVFTGNGLLTPRLAHDLDESRGKLTYIGVGLIFAMLLIFFKFKILRVIVATLPILLILGWSTAIMAAKGLTVTTVLALMPAQLMGIGVEFTVLLLMRYYEERDKGGIPMDCMITAMSRIGRAILVSGLMVMIGFGTLWFAFTFPFLSQFGWITFFDMLLVLVSTLVLLPGMVVTFDNWRDRKQAA